jgi:hypothetical protein
MYNNNKESSLISRISMFASILILLLHNYDHDHDDADVDHHHH